ncbi:MAG TPA: SDR family oxidoreductase, partial [Pseudomonadales bacterium]|nr:SDR family oxidoreductase [Pseudomonadales bacterium]
VLINNAFQLGPLVPLATTELDEEWRAALDTNLIGTLQLTQALVPALAASRGNVVMINTAAMRDIRPGFGSYAISKGALQTATRYLAQELGPQGVRVNSLVPSYIDGPPLRDAFAAMAQARGVSTDTVIEEARASLPLRFIPTGEDVARAALFLASDDARAITGASLDVNAGRYIPL